MKYVPLLSIRHRGHFIGYRSYSSLLFWAFFKFLVSFLQKQEPHIEFALSNKGQTQPRSELPSLAGFVPGDPHLLGSPHGSSGRPKAHRESSFKGPSPKVQSQRTERARRAGDGPAGGQGGSGSTRRCPGAARKAQRPTPKKGVSERQQERGAHDQGQRHR